MPQDHDESLVPSESSYDAPADGSADTEALTNPGSRTDLEPLTAVPWSLAAAGGFVAAMIALTITAGVAAAAVSLADFEPATFTLVLLSLLSGVYLIIVTAAWLAARAHGVAFAPAFGIRPVSVTTLLLGAVLATVVGRAAAGVWALVMQGLGLELGDELVDPTALFPSGWFGIAATILVAGIMAPVAEEVVFRGVLLSAFERRWGARRAVLWSSVIFALMHVVPYTLPPILVLSLIFGWLFVRTRSLWVCIFAHAAFNVSGLVALYVAKGLGAM